MSDCCGVMFIISLRRPIRKNGLLGAERKKAKINEVNATCSREMLALKVGTSSNF